MCCRIRFSFGIGKKMLREFAQVLAISFSEFVPCLGIQPHLTDCSLTWSSSVGCYAELSQVLPDLTSLQAYPHQISTPKPQVIKNAYPQTRSPAASESAARSRSGTASATERQGAGLGLGRDPLRSGQGRQGGHGLHRLRPHCHLGQVQTSLGDRVRAPLDRASVQRGCRVDHRRRARIRAAQGPQEHASLQHRRRRRRPSRDVPAVEQGPGRGRERGEPRPRDDRARHQGRPRTR
ncbi:hypothetical protein BC828DRAFT_112641 [Blastocladiella britannica]|nr:hypothetical protein BC828DRAFT_112641 [Blastocladiella britannica]